MTNKQGRLLRLALSMALSVVSLLGQGDRGQITGTVADGTGAVVPNAQITAVQKDTNSSYKAESTSAGVFTLTGLPIGEYNVSVEKQGFKTYIATAVPVNPGGAAALTVVLQIGATTQSVEV